MNASVRLVQHTYIHAYSFNNFSTDIAVAESNPVVGSSRNTKLGDMISSIPMLVRFLSPPETPLNISVPI